MTLVPFWTPPEGSAGKTALPMLSPEARARDYQAKLANLERFSPLNVLGDRALEIAARHRTQQDEERERRQRSEENRLAAERAQHARELKHLRLLQKLGPADDEDDVYACGLDLTQFDPPDALDRFYCQGWHDDEALGAPLVERVSDPLAPWL